MCACAILEFSKMYILFLILTVSYIHALCDIECSMPNEVTIKL